MSDAHKYLRTLGLAYLALLVGSLHFEQPEFRTWEVVKDPETEFFYPNQQVEMSEIGDLGFRIWTRSLQLVREGRFSTDRHGFRNPQGIERPRVVLLGDSFVAGAGLRDEQNCFLTPEQRGLADAVATTKRFADLVATRGVTLIYAPVPDSAEVYP